MSHTRTRTVLGILVALLATFATGATAEASFMNFEPSGTVTFTSAGSLSFTEGLVTVSCTSTMGGRTRAGPISISREPAGEVTSARFASCSGGTIREALFRERTPWTIKAESALGTLPSEATGLMITIENYAVTGTFGEATCLYSGTIRVLFPLSGPGYYDMEAGRIVETRLRKVSGTCSETATLAGSFSLTPTTRVYISTLAEIFNDLTKGRYTVNPPSHDWGTVGLNETIAFNFEFELRTALEVKSVNVLNDPTLYTVTGLNPREVLPAANYPLVATLRTRGLPRRSYIADYFLKLEDRGGNIYTWPFTMIGRT
jgi:hypothetical protein